MEQCCVAGCSAPTTINKDGLFHKFPRYSKLKREWLDIVPMRNDAQDPPTICSKHFLETDYKNVRGRRILYYNSVPSIFDSMDKVTDDEAEKVNPKLDNDVENEISLVKNKEDISCIVNNSNEMNSDEHKAELDVVESVKACVKDIIAETKTSKVRKGSKSDRVKRKTDERDNTDDINNDMNGKVLAPRNAKSMPKAKAKIKSKLKKVKNVTVNNEEIAKDKVDAIIDNIEIAEKNNTDDVSKDIQHDCLVTEPINNITQMETKENGLEPKQITTDIEDDIPSFIIQECKQNIVQVQIKGMEKVITGDAVEKLEVSVDPNLLMMETMITDEIEISDSDGEKPTGGQPVSLLTSSDDDDVVIEEPHVDTVEVSDETDEDDLPLEKLVRRRRQQDKTKSAIIGNIMKKYVDYYCPVCQFTAPNHSAYTMHIKRRHAAVLACPTCAYQTTSELLLKRHHQKHKSEKRLRCHLCSYRARHHMSLAFHLKNHTLILKCQRCSFETMDRGKLEKHSLTHRSQYLCPHCDFRSKSEDGLKKHLVRHEGSECEVSLK